MTENKFSVSFPCVPCMLCGLYEHPEVQMLLLHFFFIPVNATHFQALDLIHCKLCLHWLPGQPRQTLRPQQSWAYTHEWASCSFGLVHYYWWSLTLMFLLRRRNLECCWTCSKKCGKYEREPSGLHSNVLHCSITLFWIEGFELRHNSGFQKLLFYSALAK